MSTLATRDLTIRFGGHVAVNAVTCSFEPGTLTAIVGPNGAGKTTYFNLISGQIKASAGSVRLNGVDISALGAPSRAQAGLGRAFQLTNLFPNLTVRENVRLAVQARAKAGLDLFTQALRVQSQVLSRGVCAFAPLALKPLCDMRLYKSLFSDLREPPVSPGEPRILNKVAGLTT